MFIPPQNREVFEQRRGYGTWCVDQDTTTFGGLGLVTEPLVSLISLGHYCLINRQDGLPPVTFSKATTSAPL